MSRYQPLNFPSFSEGLSLRDPLHDHQGHGGAPFPFLFGGTFIEGETSKMFSSRSSLFPFLFGGTFIEGLLSQPMERQSARHFPSFSEGLSLRGLPLAY